MEPGGAPRPPRRYGFIGCGRSGGTWSAGMERAVTSPVADPLGVDPISTASALSDPVARRTPSSPRVNEAFILTLRRVTTGIGTDTSTGAVANVAVLSS